MRRRPPGPAAVAATCALLLAAAVAVLYARTANFAYLRLDDWGYTAGCPFVPTGLTRANLAQALSRVTYGGIWMPLTYASYMADVSLFGGGWGVHHAVNAALHAVNAVVAFFFIRRLLRLFAAEAECVGRRETLASFVAALVWAVHPQRVEAVAWIASRKEELWTLFAMLGLIAWSARRWLAGCLCCVLACMCKPTAVCFPLLAALLEFAASGAAAMRAGGQRRDGGKASFAHALPRYAPLFLTAAVTGLAAIGAQTRPEGMAEVQVLHVPFPARFIDALASLGYGFGRFLLPVEAHFDYLALPPMAKAGAIAFLAALCAAGAFLVRRAGAAARRTALVCCGLFVFSWLPVSGLAGSFGEAPNADRFLYMPMVAASLGLAAFLASRTARAWLFATLTFAAVSAALAWPVVSSYRNDYTAFSRTLAFEPDHWRALCHVGGEYCARLGRMDEGIEMMRRSHRVSPRDSTAEVLAYSLACRGREEDVPEILRLSAKFIRDARLDRRGMFAEALGAAALMRRKWDAAVGYLSASIAAPERFYADTEARFRLADALEGAGKLDEAKKLLRPLAISESREVRRRALARLEALRQDAPRR